MKELTVMIIGAVFTWLVLHTTLNASNKQAPEPTISECDSIHLANDSLRQRIGVLENRLVQYRIGMSFLKDKDKKAYDYVINAGNFVFNANDNDKYLP